MSDQDNKAIVRRYFEDVRNRRDVAAVNQIFSSDIVVYVDTPAGAEAVRGAEAIRQALQPYLVAFPDLRFTIEDQIAEGDRVATRWTARGTHRGPLMGHAATGRSVSFGGTDIFRLADGKIVEGWAHYDRLVILQQLGAAPALHPGGP
jgi:steroid delta-isomerase-like uncharacterized protein